METIKEKLRKIKELADKGFMGEAVAAKNKLEELLKKYDLTLSDLSNEETREYYFKYRGSYQKKIIIQTIASCSYRNLKFYISRWYKSQISVELTAMEYADALDKIEFHKSLFAKEKRKAEKALFTAYIHKHKLFSLYKDDSEDAQETKLSKEEIEAILYAMQNLSNQSFFKKLTA